MIKRSVSRLAFYFFPISVFFVCCRFITGCSSRDIRAIESEDTRGPIMISSVTPDYPDTAAELGVQGTVMVKLWVDTLGTVTTAMIQKSPSPLLDSAAFNAALATKFKPALFDGKPQGVWYIVPFEVRKK